MPTHLPDNWKSLPVREVGVKGSYPSNLVIYRVANSKNLGWRYLPEEVDDPRPNAGRNKSGKRLWEQGRTKTNDPYEAGKRAKTQANERVKQQIDEARNLEVEVTRTLTHYWDLVIDKKNRETSKRNLVRDIRDLKSIWARINKHSDIPRKKVDEITYEDHVKLFAATEGKTRKGVGSKEDIRKVLNKAYRQAMLGEFKHWSPPPFPQYSRQKKGRPSLKSDDWDRLIKKVIELSGGCAKQDLTPDAYKSLEWDGRK